MKEQDVPQDLQYFKDKVVRDVMYAVDEEGCYKPVISDGWSVKNDALSVVWDDIKEQCEEIRKKVEQKELSPLAFHAKKNLLDKNMLSAYSGIPRCKVKRHFNYDDFMKLDENTLMKYADALRITIEELKKVYEWR
ncbi:MAG: hypothetical protein LBT24_01700 [Tannerella sp.]|jgi:hypothetical protein|nr:hypothetical protein [Tannerella sp.]